MAELREAFSREHALQCGYCTPGMLVTARDIVLRLPDADERDIRVALSGNLCRCTGYVGIVRAVQSVIADRRARGIAPVAGRRHRRARPGRVGASGRAGRAVAMPTRHDVAPTAWHRSGGSGRGHAEPRSGVRSGVPQVTIEQHFTVAHPPEKVWAFFGRPPRSRVPAGRGADRQPTEDRVEGKLRVKAGPIVAEFAGAAEIERDVSHYAGMIRGQGKDNRSGSATRGEIAYKLSPEAGGNATRVDVTVGYTLTGMLAQFSRSGLIQDVANRLTSAFAKNLEMRLGTEGALEQAAPAAELNAGSMIFSVLGDRLRRFLRRLFKR